MLEAIIIDDNVISIRSILCLTDSIEDIRCVGTSNNIKDGLALVKTIHPNIVFLDNNIAKSSDSNLLLKLQRPNLHVIFLKSNNGPFSGINNFPRPDWLLKPIQLNELQKVIGKYMKNNNLTHDPNNPEARKIPIRTCTGIEVFDIETIVRFEACGNYCMVYFENERKIISSKSLKYFEELLSKFDFTRINRQDLVHTRFIRKIFKGRYPILELMNNKRLKVSDRKRKVVRKLLVNS